MSDKPEQTEPTTEEIVDKLDEMPAVEELRTYDAPTQKAILDKFGAVENDDDDEDSDQSDDQSDDDDSDEEDKPKDQDQEDEEEEEEDDSSNSDDSDPEDDSDKQKKKEKSKTDDSANKELQAEFTRRSQRLKKVEKENTDLRERLAKLEGIVEGKSEQAPKKKLDTSPLRALAKDNPKLAPLVDAIEAQLDMTVDPVKDKIDKQKQDNEDKKRQDTENQNHDTFSEKVLELLDGPLGELEDEFDAIAAKEYGDADSLEEAARKDPNLFEKLKAKLVDKHLDKVTELLTKAKEDKEDEEEEDPKEKVKRVKKTGVSGKSKTAGKKAADDLSSQIKALKKKPGGSKKIKELLAKHGAVSEE